MFLVALLFAAADVRRWASEEKENLAVEDIWARWALHYERMGIDPARICRDGILNPEAYRQAPVKVLFIMKEVNDWKGGDLRDLLADGPKYQMWHSVARWAAGVLGCFPRYETIDNYNSMKGALRQVATLNLKKTSGGSWADSSVINAYAFLDRDLLLDQIEAIAPQVIVACGTFDSLVWLLELKLDPDSPKSKPARDEKRRMWVVPFRHPARVNNSETYDELKGLFCKLPNNGMLVPS